MTSQRTKSSRERTDNQTREQANKHIHAIPAQRQKTKRQEADGRKTTNKNRGAPKQTPRTQLTTNSRRKKTERTKSEPKVSEPKVSEPKTSETQDAQRQKTKRHETNRRKTTNKNRGAPKQTPRTQ